MNSKTANRQVAQASAADVKTATLEAPGKKREVIDSVFTQLGFDRLFLDVGHPPRIPNMNIKESNAPLVLHVDDDVDLVNAVTARFKASGYRVASALDGQSGVEEALTQPANAIVLDYDMPNGRGDTVIGLLKSNEKTKHIPIVVLTAVHKRGLERQLINQGADKFMTKPFEFSELESNVAALIDAAGNL